MVWTTVVLFDSNLLMFPIVGIQKGVGSKCFPRRIDEKAGFSPPKHLNTPTSELDEAAAALLKHFTREHMRPRISAIRCDCDAFLIYGQAACLSCGQKLIYGPRNT